MWWCGLWLLISLSAVRSARCAVPRPDIATAGYCNQLLKAIQAQNILGVKHLRKDRGDEGILRRGKFLTWLLTALCPCLNILSQSVARTRFRMSHYQQAIDTLRKERASLDAPAGSGALHRGRGGRPYGGGRRLPDAPRPLIPTWTSPPFTVPCTSTRTWAW